MRRRSSDSRRSASSGAFLLRCLLASAVALPVSLVLSAPQARATAICPTGFVAVNSPVTICQRTLTVTGNWTVPAGVTSIDYVLVGAGGGGGATSSDWYVQGGAGGSGGAGAGGSGCSSGGAGGFGGGGGGGGACGSNSWLGGRGGNGAVFLRTAAIVPAMAESSMR